MSCIKLIQGQDSVCKTYAKKYFQQAVFINKADVEEHLILLPATTIEGEYQCRYRIAFNLFEGKKGFRFTASENANNIFGTFSKTTVENIPQYKHSIQIPIFGVSEENRCIFDQLDNGDYFGVLQYYDGTVEVFGFNYGLTTPDYEYNPANNGGGGLIMLESVVDEDDMPYIYFNGTGTEGEDFDNSFEGGGGLPMGDFSNDFSDDFYNIGS